MKGVVSKNYFSDDFCGVLKEEKGLRHAIYNRKFEINKKKLISNGELKLEIKTWFVVLVVTRFISIYIDCGSQMHGNIFKAVFY